MAVTGAGAEEKPPPALGLIVASQGLGEARHLGSVRGQAIVRLLEDAVVAFAGVVELGLHVTSFDDTVGPAVAGIELREALERTWGHRVELGEALELPALGAGVAGLAGEPGTQLRHFGLGVPARRQVSQGSAHLVGSAGIARPEEPGTPDRGVVGASGETLAEPGLGVVELAGPAVEVRQTKPDAVVVGGAAGRLFEHEAGACHGYSLEFEKPKVAEHAYRVGRELQFLQQKLPRLVAAVLEPQGALEHFAGLRRMRAIVGDRPPKQVFGPSEVAAFKKDRCDPCGGEPGER